MAKPKKPFLIKVLSGDGIHVWADKTSTSIDEIREIEGVDAVLVGSSGPISIYVDPRYDKNEVAEEIRELLSSEVPQVFRE